MSWKDKIENVQLTIITGDGKEFTPLWRNASKNRAYNVSGYNFIGVEGTYVDRKKPQGAKFSLVLWFQGEDNIDQAEQFEISAADPRPWELKHPFYGNIKGQPVSLSRDDSSLNTTQMTVEFWESINDDYPNTDISIEEVVKSKTEIVGELAAENYAVKSDPDFGDTKTIQDNVNLISGSFKTLLNDANFSEYQQAVNKALKSANNVVSAPLGAALDAQQVILLPSLYASNVESRISSLGSAYKSMTDFLIKNNTKNDKLYYESNGATIVAAMCQASIEPASTDYVTAVEIENITETITSTFENYLATVDSLQTNIGESLDVYIPDDITQRALYDLVAEATANLFQLAFSAKKERKVIVKKGTNLVLLAHRYIGLDINDQNIEDFRQTNGIKNDNLFYIKKDTIIRYFV